MKAAAQFRSDAGLVSSDTTIVAFGRPAMSSAKWGAKRAFDVVVSLAIMVCAAPLFLVAAVWVRVFSPGPVLFQQERVGLRGRRFRCYKFRTMKVDSTPALHREYMQGVIQSNVPMRKLDMLGDFRLIPGAWLLRASGLDELPQLFNVLRGEMSLVGPRPCLPYEWQQCNAWQRERGTVLPGITGLWQVSGKNRTTFEEMIHLDFLYLGRASIGYDLTIIARTVPALCREIVTAIREERAGVAAPEGRTSAGADTDHDCEAA